MPRLSLLVLLTMPFLAFNEAGSGLIPVKKEIVNKGVAKKPRNLNDPEFIDWAYERPLNWVDFEGPINRNTDAAASTSTYLGLEYNIRNNEFTYSIGCKFSKKKSWGLVKNDWILDHEQGHFDITELFARMLNQKMSEYNFDRKNYRKDIDHIYKDVLAQKEAFQDLYDTQSNYSRSKKDQRQWLDKIETLLEETKAFAEYN